MNGENGSPTLLDYLNFAGRTGTDVLGKLQRPAPQAAPSKTNWTLIGGIAAAVLGVLVLVMVVSKK